MTNLGAALTVGFIATAVLIGHSTWRRWQQRRQARLQAQALRHARLRLDAEARGARQAMLTAARSKRDYRPRSRG